MFFFKKAPFSNIDIISTIQRIRVELDYDEDEEVFEEACNVAFLIPQKEIDKTYRRTKASKELIAYNIIQNSALMLMKNSSYKDMLFMNSSYRIYNEINEIKLEKNLITKKQFDENEMVGRTMMAHAAKIY